MLVSVELGHEKRRRVLAFARLRSGTPAVMVLVAIVLIAIGAGAIAVLLGILRLFALYYSGIGLPVEILSAARLT